MARERHHSRDDSQWKRRVTCEKNAKIFLTGELQCNVDGKELTLNARSSVIELNAADLSTLFSLARSPLLGRRLNVRMNRVSRLLGLASQRLEIYVAGVKVAAAGEGVSSVPTSMIGVKNWRVWPFRIVGQIFVRRRPAGS